MDRWDTQDTWGVPKEVAHGRDMYLNTMSELACHNKLNWRIRGATAGFSALKTYTEKMWCRIYNFHSEIVSKFHNQLPKNK